MKRISLWSVDRDDTLHLDDEIVKLEDAHSVMIAANRALVEGDDLSLTRLGFDIDHIEDLKERHAQGKPGFPGYVMRNLQDTIQQLSDLKRGANDGRGAKVVDQN
ncbi:MULTISPECIES: hypothetical protein [Pseudomonas syringae group]|uniref:hypothetical protein n=1 Tax=Pseudomonas syringae group TaxID=136849 RepID=UPI00051706AB|nr:MULTISPECIES: hypothetical protein [Pseudomonas syringae group]KWT14656.1 hypothetical protein AL041_11815 [Pseudomonas amygdali pv. aesculi]KWT20569.1 hypothetical protein AL043_27760 [Pseudomonas amygdali pv. aesculi]KWT26830.1 hypothetical protein AL042_14270 [Pseudomonas amygdali pv. aesculi]KWT32200.1 hypothetical protein AL044_09905 [Pseudomonas amygdali pv. aesculi]KWT36122.1 hypothetical protein AL045_25415 [Pseudomonas amygdali pv. aesculi]